MRAFIFLLGILFLSGCTSSEELVIGFSGGLSGRHSETAVSVRNGVDLAVAEINQSGGINGRPVRIIVRDDRNDPQELERVVVSMKKEGAVAVIGPLFSRLAVAARDTATKLSIPFVSPTISTILVEGQDDYFFRVMQVTSEQGRILANHALKSGYKKVAFIVDVSNKEYTTPIRDTFAATFKDHGGNVVSLHETEGGKSDFAVVASDIVKSGADCVVMLTIALDAASIAQQFAKLNSIPQLYGARWSKTPDLLAHGGRAVEGMILESTFIPDKPSERLAQFQQSYQKTYGTDPAFVAYYGYDAMMVVRDAIAKHGTNALDIKKGIVQQKTFAGLESEFTINEFGDALRPSSLVVVKNGSFEVIR